MELPIPEVEEIDNLGYYVVGIDPDITASGIAIWNREKSEYISYTRIKFFELYELLDNMLTYGIRFEAVIEAGWMNRSKTHHVDVYATRSKAARIGADVGANHEVGRKIVEMCDWLGVQYRTLTPTSSKWTPTMLHHLTGIELSKSQQDVIDAMRLVYRM